MGGREGGGQLRKLLGYEPKFRKLSRPGDVRGHGVLARPERLYHGYALKNPLKRPKRNSVKVL